MLIKLLTVVAAASTFPAFADSARQGTYGAASASVENASRRSVMTTTSNGLAEKSKTGVDYDVNPVTLKASSDGESDEFDMRHSEVRVYGQIPLTKLDGAALPSGIGIQAKQETRELSYVVESDQLNLDLETVQKKQEFELLGSLSVQSLTVGASLATGKYIEEDDTKWGLTEDVSLDSKTEGDVNYNTIRVGAAYKLSSLRLALNYQPGVYKKYDADDESQSLNLNTEEVETENRKIREIAEIQRETVSGSASLSLRPIKSIIGLGVEREVPHAEETEDSGSEFVGQTKVSLAGEVRIMRSMFPKIGLHHSKADELSIREVIAGLGYGFKYVNIDGSIGYADYYSKDSDGKITGGGIRAIAGLEASL